MQTLQEVIRECAMTCAALQLRQPLTLYSDSLADVGDIFTALLQAAEKPDKSLAIPLTPSLKVIASLPTSGPSRISLFIWGRKGMMSMITMQRFSAA